MIGLLQKSWKNVRPVIGYYLFFGLLFFVVSAVGRDPLYFSVVGVLLAVAPSLTSLSRDEADGWDAFAVAAGVSRARLALSRYLFALCCVAPAWAVSAALVFCAQDRLRALAVVLFFAGAGMIAASVMLPLCLRFGVEKARVLLIVVAILLFAAATTNGILFFGEGRGGAEGAPHFALPCAVLAAGVLAAAVSLLAGIRILQRKDL